MKTIRIGAIAIMTLIGINVQAKEKLPITFEVSRTIAAPAEKVWEVVGEGFADVHKSHPVIDHSGYLDGSEQAGEGCERVCAFDDKGKKYTHEKQIDYDPANMTFKALIFAVDGLPMAKGDDNFAIYNIEEVDKNSSKLTLSMSLITDPYFMGKMAKKKFKKTITNYLIGIEHYVLTGETVTKQNFKKIKKQYES